MPTQRKTFRIEQNVHDGAAVPAGLGDDLAALRHHEVITELAALRALLEQRTPADSASLAAGLETVAEARELKSELDLIHEAIRRTKQEIAGLEPGEFIGSQMDRVGRELDAVIAGTEQATENILKSAEEIDQIVNTLSPLLKDGYAQGLAQDARDHVVKIFEACNFQDLTGQRISRVIATLKFIEGHIDRMQEIWRRIEGTAPAAPPSAKPDIDRRLLNGPKLPDDPGHSTQADVDLIFGGY
jgi:chemotaxis protein CheZ